MNQGYNDFLASKAIVFDGVGFTPKKLNRNLFPFQHDIDIWACQKGRAAVFADCGLGKTVMQLAWADAIHKETGENVLIPTPLAVSLQTIQEGEKFGINVKQSRNGKPYPITITNYDMLDKFNPDHFIGVALDESSILKAFDGKTRTMIIDMFSRTPYRSAWTATPSPNDFMELGNHAEFLGIMTYVEMLAKFFYHDGGDTSKWILKRHAENDFWRWVCSWAVMIRKPSDLGKYDDTGFILPKLNTFQHAIDSDICLDSSKLISWQATTLEEQRKVKRETIETRCQLCADTVNKSPEEWLIWCELNPEGDLLEKLIPDSVQVSGSDSLEEKERKLSGFVQDGSRVLITKPKIGGFGMNWQHCRNIYYVGTSHSFEKFYQTLRRCLRFGQKREVNCHINVVDMEGSVFENLMRKEADATRMQDQMLKHMSVYQNVGRTERLRDNYQVKKESGEHWDLWQGDCVELIKQVETGSIQYSIFSPPFASLYTYSNSVRDMGNCESTEQFMEHFSFLVKELLRVTAPGRLLSFHCMNLPSSKQRDGYIGLKDFRGELIRIFVDAGWIYHSEVCIWKDPVTAMQRTKALGLLHKQIKKDATMCRQGVPDYLVTMRKPGDNTEPVKNTDSSFPVDLWQRYASPVWFDINPSKTLQRTSARDEEDEKHICPLQLEVIERALFLWTNPGDLVLSPFAGIGSEGYVSVEMGRKFLGFELKDTYYDQAVNNLQGVSQRKNMKLIDAFGDEE
jgi:hypothetical protein